MRSGLVILLLYTAIAVPFKLAAQNVSNGMSVDGRREEDEYQKKLQEERQRAKLASLIRNEQRVRIEEQVRKQNELRRQNETHRSTTSYVGIAAKPKLNQNRSVARINNTLSSNRRNLFVDISYYIDPNEGTFYVYISPLMSEEYYNSISVEEMFQRHFPNIDIEASRLSINLVRQSECKDIASFQQKRLRIINAEKGQKYWVVTDGGNDFFNW